MKGRGILLVPIGSFANGRREPRQIRKEAAVSGVSVVRMLLVGVFFVDIQNTCFWVKTHNSQFYPCNYPAPISFKQNSLKIIWKIQCLPQALFIMYQLHH
jgi:hypothetical protein